MVIGFLVTTEKFERDISKIRDEGIKTRLKKQILKLLENPDFGKPLKYDLKGERSIRIKPYRLLYKLEGDKVILLRLEHRDHAYER